MYSYYFSGLAIHSNCFTKTLYIYLSLYLSPHPYSHGLSANRRPHSKPLPLVHELIEQERLARVELAHHCHHCHGSVNVVQVLDVAADYLKFAVVVWVGADQLQRPLREDT